jgi:hypothetical protein
MTGVERCWSFGGYKIEGSPGIGQPHSAAANLSGLRCVEVA